MKKIRFLSTLLLACAVLAACSSIPPQNVMLEEARSNYMAAQNNPNVTRLASAELQSAGVALDQANAAFAARDDNAKIDKLAYLAKQKIAIAEEVGKQKAAEATVSAGVKERDQLLLQQRTMEADNAKATAQVAQNSAADAQARARQLEQMLNDLSARKTERGMVITLSDVLFNVDQDQLKQEGVRNVQKLAEFMKQYPQRTVLIEGYTDSTGSVAHNIDLSNRRAAAVRATLVSMGVSPERIATVGKGEANPVASNNTPGNRQLNRRVEIVLSDDSGKIPAG